MEMSFTNVGGNLFSACFKYPNDGYKNIIIHNLTVLFMLFLEWIQYNNTRKCLCAFYV